MAASEYVEVYTDAEHKVRWRFRGANNRIMADSGQGYVDRADAYEAIEIVTGRPIETVSRATLMVKPDTPDVKSLVKAMRGERTIRVVEVPVGE